MRIDKRARRFQPMPAAVAGLTKPDRLTGQLSLPVATRTALLTPHQRYEHAKREWDRANPDASPRDYEIAMRRLAREAGI